MRSKSQYALLVIGILFTTYGLWMGIVENEVMGMATALFFGPGTAISVVEMWPNLFRSKARPLEALQTAYPGPVQLRASRNTMIYWAVVSASMGAGLLLMALYHPVNVVMRSIFWIGCVFFLGGSVIVLFKAVRANRICLRGDGLELVHGGRKSVTRWTDTSPFKTAYIPASGTSLVVFDDAQEDDTKTVSMNRKLFGCSSALPDSYGLDHETMVDLLNYWRSRALDGHEKI